MSCITIRIIIATFTPVVADLPLLPSRGNFNPALGQIYPRATFTLAWRIRGMSFFKFIPAIPLGFVQTSGWCIRPREPRRTGKGLGRIRGESKAGITFIYMRVFFERNRRLIPYTSAGCQIRTSHSLHVSRLPDRDVSYPTRQPAARQGRLIPYTSAGCQTGTSHTLHVSRLPHRDVSYLTRQPAARQGRLIPYTSAGCQTGTSHTLHVSRLPDRDVSYPTRQPAARYGRLIPYTSAGCQIGTYHTLHVSRLPDMDTISIR